MQIFTLASGEYVYGAAALCNSLCGAGFKGEIHVGYVEKLEWDIDPSAPIIFHKLPAQEGWHSDYKPSLLLDHASEIFVYLDSDCLVMRPAFLDSVSEVVDAGPVFCAEGFVPEHDVRRLIWRRIKEDSIGGEVRADQLRVWRPTNTYFNAGFIAGDIRRDRWVLAGWKRMIETALPGSGALFETRYFPMLDQDCLNAFIQDEHFTFSCISPPDIWYAISLANPFFHVGNFEASLLHCTGPKPWQHRSVPARPPNIYEAAWYHFLFDDTPWVCPKPTLPKSVLSWIRGERWGSGISRLKRIKNRIGSL